jgi:hypothetical protein
MSKLHSTSTIEEQALAMYAETVSPSKETLVSILNQIPEIKETELQDRRAIRSPYRWLAIAELVSVFVIALAVYPALRNPEITQNPFYAVDQQVETFEQNINAQDEAMMLNDYTL